MFNPRILAWASFGFFIALQVSESGSTILKAQTTTATVSGTVTDSAGGVVPGVSVRVKNADTGITQSTVTDDTGRFRALNLPIGTYDVEAARTGFKTVIRRPVMLGVGTTATVDFSLEVGSPEETIFVEASLSLVETRSPALSSISTFNERQLQNLPLNGRNLLELVTMNPGVTAAMRNMPAAPSGVWGMNMAMDIYGGEQSHSISGARTEGQAFLLDNTNIQGFWNRGIGSGAVGSSLGVEAMAGLQVLTNSYGAEFGGNGSVVNITTKSGTNSFHGSVYEFMRNSALNARNFFDTTAERPPFRKNQFGVSLGGPIKKDGLFFFFNYEGLRQAQTQTVVGFVPDANVRRGILPGLSAPVIIHSSIKPILDLYPLPNGRNLGGGVGEYRTTADSLAHENYFLGRLDWVMSSRDSLFARYVSDRGDSLRPFEGSPIPLWPEQDRTANQYFTLQERRIISASLVNSSKFSFVRPVETGAAAAKHDALQLFPGLGREDALVTPGGGISWIGSDSALPFSLVQNRFAYADDVAWVRGAHNFQLGVSVERIQTNPNTPYFRGGWYRFNDLEQFLRGLPASFLGVAAEDGNSARYFREATFTPYFEDQFKVTPRLTLNIGLRYDYGTNPVGMRNPLYTLLDPPNGTEFEQVKHVFKSSPNKKNWDPRFGLGWDPFNDHKTAVRAGFGMFHDRVAPRTYSQAFTFNPPFVTTFLPAPSFPTPFPAVPALPTGNIYGVLYDLPHVPYEMDWSLSLQREIINSVVTVSYVGSRGVHLFVPRDLNPPKPVVSPDGVARYGTLTPLGVVPNPAINPAFGRLTTLVPDGNSNYNSLQVSFDRRVTRKLSAMLSYTWSKCIDNGSVSFLFEERAAIPGIAPVLSNPYDARRDRGRCSFDIRHSFRGGSMISSPFQGNRLLDGWMLSTIVMANSGQPFSITDGFDQAGFGSFMVPSRPDAITGCRAILGRVNQWYDPACFRVQPVGLPGNLGRNTLTGPSLFTTDLALIRDIKLREPVTMQLRAEIFNAFNHPNFGLPDPAAFVSDGAGGAKVSPTAGKITTTTTQGRQIQFGLKIIF